MTGIKIVSFLLAAAGFVVLPAKVMADVPFAYGQHFPNGKSAVDYIYGPRGNFRQINNIQYVYDYYDRTTCPNGRRPVDRNALVAYSTGSNQTTAPSADCHVLLDLNEDGEPDYGGGSAAFQEHNGYGYQGTQGPQASPFNQFWFDDNWLARYMASAYQTTQPWGLYNPSTFNRYAIIGGDTTNWRGYSGDFFDYIAFRGLFDISIGNTSAALGEWNRWITKSGATYNTSTARYEYPQVTANYWLGQFRILTENLLRYGSLTTAQRDQLVQHSVSLRSVIISNQVSSNGVLEGWITDQPNSASLMNTETVAFQVLGLGAGGKWALEASQAPMNHSNSGFFVRPTSVISGVVGQSQPGTLVYGPRWQFPVGTYTASFYIRSPGPANNAGTIDIYDAVSGTALAGRPLQSSSFASGNRWTVQSLTFTVSSESNSLEFRVGWSGTATVDVAFIQVS